MQTKFVILLCAISAVVAYPYEPTYEPTNYLMEPLDEVQYAAYPANQDLYRVRRQLTGSGGGSAGKGFDVNLDGRMPVWQSNNGRHQVDAMAGYSQHLGGPYGNSRPDFRGGAGYTFRF